MGTAAGPAAAGMSLASMAVNMFGEYTSSRGQAAGDTYRAEELDRAAQYGDLQATQVNAQMTRNMAINLAKLDTIRAAAHTSPFSPTGAAVRGFTEETDTQNKNIKVTSIMEQAQQDEADAAYERFAGSQALLSGDISMVGTALSGTAGAVSSYNKPFGIAA